MKTLLLKSSCFVLGMVFSLPYLAIQWAKVCYNKKELPWNLIGK